MTEEELMKHEDAFQAANKYSGDVVNMASRPINELSVKRMQKEHLELFEAFIAGVDWARKQQAGEVVP